MLRRWFWEGSVRRRVQRRRRRSSGGVGKGRMLGMGEVWLMLVVGYEGVRGKAQTRSGGSLPVIVWVRATTL